MCSGVIAKCLNQRAKTKDLGVAILMAFIEAEKQEIVQVCLLLLAVSSFTRDFDEKVWKILLWPLHFMLCCFEVNLAAGAWD